LRGPGGHAGSYICAFTWPFGVSTSSLLHGEDGKLRQIGVVYRWKWEEYTT